ncbi:cupin domain-containing protein [Halopelagius longus]|uniref:Cupin domain-containing protein n=1 Tax=Halopelagius longus TaxID=1236180 RepID=A0A1H1GSZ1_9EURY|nr:cupin domain-containing protein [Halopelagius longus]RDI69584.1 cupin domain-containing protein [Halopelagius longus]SDR16297.1 Cupin domain-containing protein [Halopelagius longus]
MKKIRIDDVENSLQPAAVMRQLTEPLEATDLAINYYELEPGDSFSFAYHRHEVQEELFYVQAGTATFETEDGDVDVGAGEIIRFPPGEFQRGWNRGEEPVVALALGAPLEYGHQVKLRDCPSCETQTDSTLERRAGGDADEDSIVAVCVDCGTVTGRWTKGPMPGDVP